MNVKFFRERMAQGFRKQVTASGSRVTLPRSKGKDLLDYKIKQRSEKCVTINGTEYGVADNITLHESVANGLNTMVDTGVNCSDDMEFFCRLECNTLDSFYLLQRRSTLNPSINGLTGSNSGAKISLAFNGGYAVSNITRTVGHVYAIKGTVLNGTLTLYVKDETTGTEDTKTGTYTVGTLPTDNVTMFGNAKNDSIASGNVVYEAYIKKNGSYAWYIIGDYDVIGKSVITATRGTLTAGKTTKTVEVSGQSIEVPLFHYRGVGDKTANEFNPSDADTRYPNGWYSSGGTIENSVINNRTIIIPCSEGDVFTFKHYTEASGARYFWIYSDTVAIGEPCSAMYGTMISINAVTTNPAPSNAKYIGICFWRTTAGTVQSAADDFVVVKGSTAPTEHIPFGYDRHIVTATGGMVDMGTLNWTFYQSDPRFYATISDSVNRAGRYIDDVFCDGYTPSGSGEDKTMFHNGKNIIIYDSRFTDAAAFKAAMSGKYLYYQRATDDSFSVNHYHVYTDEQGFSCGDVADEVSFLNGDVLNVGCKVFDGTEDWTDSGTRYYTPIAGRKKGNDVLLTCSHPFNLYAYATVNVGFTKTEMPSSVTDVDTWKAYLAAQYANGTPVKVWYPLATPVTKQIAAPTVQTQTGMMHFDVVTETEPSGGEIIYRSGIAPTRDGLYDLNGNELYDSNGERLYCQ